MAAQPNVVSLAQRREVWLQERKSGIGGSDAPAVLGVSSFKTQLELFNEKLGLADATQQTERMEWGLRLEGAIVEAYAEKTGRAVVKREPYTITRSSKHPFMFATLDAEVEDPKLGRGTLQAKCSEYDWDEETPTEYLVQIQHEMEVGGFNWGSLALLVRGNRFRYIDVERHDRVISHIVEREAEFMERIKKLEPPPAGPADADALATLYRKTTGEVIAVPAEVGNWFDEKVKLDEEIAKLTERQDHIKNACRQILGEAVFGMIPDGRRISWSPTKGQDAVLCTNSLVMKCECGKEVTSTCGVQIKPPVPGHRTLRFHKK